MPWGRRRGGETGVEMDAGHDDSQAVRAEDPHAVELALLVGGRLLPVSRPAGPASRNPAERMMMPRMPFSPQDRTMPGTAGGGRADHGQIGDVGSALDVAGRPGFPAPSHGWD